MVNQESFSLEQGKAITAVLAMLVAQRQDARTDEEAENRPTEVILSSVGLTDPEIALLVGKTPNAVKKTRQRERDRTRKKGARSGKGS